ncbi:MAG: PilZ domain-containing protein [Myxococcales bacterium]|nr:PilZ domain-containing protein [Myxococcales bacterium]
MLDHHKEPTLDVQLVHQSKSAYKAANYNHMLDRASEVKQPEKELQRLTTQRRKLYDHYRTFEAHRQVDPESIQEMHNMLLRIFAKPHDLPSLYTQLEEECEKELAQIEELFTKCQKTLAMWTKVSDEIRHRLRLLDSLEIRLTLFAQKKEAAEKNQKKATEKNQQKKERLDIGNWQANPTDTIPDLPAATESSRTQMKTHQTINLGSPVTHTAEYAAAAAPAPQLYQFQQPLVPPKLPEAPPKTVQAKAPSPMQTSTPSEQAGAERRRAPRLRLASDITIGREEHCFFTGFSENISSGGVFIATYEALPKKGSIYELCFSLPTGEIIQSEVEVMWSRDFNEQTPEISPGFGCRFRQLKKADQERIDQYIAKEGSLFMLEEEELAA